jgi:23S rRNA (adenine2503-C2)-methyltransferase
MAKQSLLDKPYEEIERIVLSLGGSPDHARRVAYWIYSQRVPNPLAMNNIPLSLRRALNNDFEIGTYPWRQRAESNDGTVRYLFENSIGQRFEAVFMPGPKRNTLCISTQSGCRMGCAFCLTGSIGFNGNLQALDIVNQLHGIPEGKMVNRLVIMGMGEPFDNLLEVRKAVGIFTAGWGYALGKANITLSTVGVLERIDAFLGDPFCNLAISLHSPFADERARLMPIEKSNPIRSIIEAIRSNPLRKPLRVSFEYIALGGVNTTDRHAEAVAELLRGINCHLNIIPWNAHEGSAFTTPATEELTEFIRNLNRYGVLTTIRQSRGKDIKAACGQMAGKIG